MRGKITAEELREILRYDPDTGLFHWRKSGTGHRWHGIAGTKNARGYVQIYIKPHRYAAHQLAWLYVHGDWVSGRLDHISGVRHENWIANLRPATSHENARHHKRRVTNRSGRTGVYFSPKERGGVWIAAMRLPDKTLRKRFRSYEEAVACRSRWEQEHHGEFAAMG